MIPLEPEPHQDAPAASSPPTPPDLTQCEKEPIHVPGAIQPHGALLALHGPELQIVQASETCRAILDVPAEALLGRPLATALADGAGATLAEAVRAAQVRWRQLPVAPAALRWRQPGAERSLAGHVHESGQVVVLELEPTPRPGAEPADALAEAVLVSQRIRAQTDLPGKLQVAAESVRRLTGYDRVMIYRFHDDWHGEVVAEDRRADLEPYLGLHYPASDIPAQALLMYLVSPTRVIVDVDYTPSPVLPALNPFTGQPLDLTRSVLRSVSPVHLEYLRNMGVGATLVASLICDGRLWGLISCHHAGPHACAEGTRSVATWLAQDLSTLIALEEEYRGRRHADALRRYREEIVLAVRGGMRLSEVLHGPQLPALLASLAADGVALVHGEEVVCGGTTPGAERVLQIARGLATRQAEGASELFATDCLSAQLTGTEDLAAIAAGVGMLPLGREQPMRLLWFRGERLRLVKWGGNPDKSVQVGADGRISPRQSFAAWSESVGLHSLGWREEELESARELGAMLQLELRRVAEEAVMQAHRQLSAVLESAGDAIAMVDAAHRLMLFNSAAVAEFARAYGATPRPGDSLRELLARHPVDLANALEHWDRALGGEDFGVTQEFGDPALGVGAYELRYSPVRNGNGQVTHAVSVVRNVTERRKAEETIRRQEEWLRAIYAGSPAGIVRTDFQRMILDANPAFLRIVGYELDELVGSSIERVIHPDSRQYEAGAVRDLLEGRTPTIHIEARWLRRDGTPIWVALDVQTSAGEGPQRRFLFGIVQDITEERKASESLRLSEARFRSLFEGHSAVMLLVDPSDGAIVDANPAAAKFYGYEKARLRSMNITAVNGLPREEVQQRMEHARTRRSNRFSFQHQLADGSLRMVDVSSSPVEIEGRRLLFSIVQDVTDRERAQTELRRVLREQEIILESANVGILVSVDRVLRWVNRTMEELFGYQREELIGQSTRVLYPTDEAFEATGRALAGSLQVGRAYDADVEMQRKDGTPIWVRINGRQIDPATPAVGVLWVVSDQTQRRQASEALRQSEARFRRFFEGHSSVMLLADPSDGAIVDVNPAAVRFYGYERSTLQRMTLGQINVVAGEVLAKSLAGAASSEWSTLVVRHRLASGAVRWMEINTAPLSIDGRTLLLDINQDVTARVEAEQQLAAQRAEIEELNRSLEKRVAQAVAELRTKDQLLITQNRQAAMGEMIGNIAHQWRQPLTALGMVLANLKDASSFGQLDDALLTKAVDESDRLIQQMSSTINDFRDFFRPGKEKKAFSAQSQIRETLALLAASFKHTGIEVRVEAPADLLLFGLPNEYRQVLMNLLTNARQAILAAKVTEGRVTVRLAERDRQGCVAVTDNGGGIPAELLHRVGEPYLTTKEGGTGLGVYMSRQIVERSMGGRLVVRNVDGGAEFAVITPLAPETGAVPPPPEGSGHGPR